MDGALAGLSVSLASECVSSQGLLGARLDADRYALTAECSLLLHHKVRVLEAYTILKFLLLPPGIILILLAIAFFLVRGTLGRLLLFLSWSLLLIMSLPGVAVPMLGTLESYPALAPDRLADTGAQAIVVLGAYIDEDAPEYGGPSPDGNSLKRIRYAAWLHRKTGLPIYVSGGSGEHAPAPVMARVLEQEYGVPTARVEKDSRTTWENAELTAPLLHADGIRRVLLVTQAWHMPRAVAAFERAGVEVIPAPTAFVNNPDGEKREGSYKDWLPQASAFLVSFYAVHELLGQFYYDAKARLGFRAAPEPARQVGG